MTKSDLLSMLEAQPERLDVESLIEQIILREKIAAGEKDIAEGRVVTHEEAVSRILGQTATS